MTRLGLVLSGMVFMAAASALSRPGAVTGDRILLDAPRGGWLAAVRGDAPLQVVEVRDGWRRVRVEGWVPVGDAPASSEPAPRSEGGGKVRGVLLPSGEGSSSSAGAGLVVLLLSDLEGLDREHSATGEQCRTGLKELDERLASLQEDLTRSLNSTDNFRQATERSDRLKSRIAQTGQERSERLRDCRTSAETIFARHAAQKGISDSRGAFEFDGVAPGRYRVFASDPAGPSPRAWLLECVVTAPGDAIVLDPRHDRSAIDPYWGLR